MPMCRPLRTERLVLRSLTRADIPALVAGLNDFSVSKWLTVVPFPYTAADAAAFVDAVASGSGFGALSITRAPTRATTNDGGPVIGVIGIGDGLGYWLARAHHGHGYMSEAAAALVGAWFAETGAAALTSGCFEGNAASARVLGKLGFRPSHDERVHARARDAEVTLHRMRLTRADWQRRKGGADG